MTAVSPSTDRRQFLAATSGLLAAGVFAWPSSSCSGATAAPSRVGVIGATGRGDYGHAVDMAFTKIPELQIVAVADADDKGRAEAQHRLQATSSYADYREMLQREQLHIVAICSRWIDQHADMIIAAAEAGCHVYLEKPFCPTLEACDAAIAALERNGCKLAIAHISQYSPVLERVRALIADGEIGDLLEFRARGKEDHRGGAEDLWVLGSHVLGLMRTLADGDPLSCSAVVTAAGRPISPADRVDGAEGLGLLAGDHVQARYRFKKDLFGYFASRRNMAGKLSRFGIQILGSKGMMEMESGYLVPAHLLRDSSWSPGRSGVSWEEITSAGIGRKETRSDGGYEGGHIAAILDLLSCIQEDRTPRCSAYDGRAIVEMIAAVFESQRTGGPVDLPLTTRVNPLTLLE